MHRIFRGLALKVIEVLNHGVIVGSPFELQTGDPFETTQSASPLSVVHSPLVGIGVEEVVNFFVVELDIRARDCYLSGPL